MKILNLPFCKNLLSCFQFMISLLLKSRIYFHQKCLMFWIINKLFFRMSNQNEYHIVVLKTILLLHFCFQIVQQNAILLDQKSISHLKASLTPSLEGGANKSECSLLLALLDQILWKQRRKGETELTLQIHKVSFPWLLVHFLKLRFVWILIL